VAAAGRFFAGIVERQQQALRLRECAEGGKAQYCDKAEHRPTT
jgi:hypothetical protein